MTNEEIVGCNRRCDVCWLHLLVLGIGATSVAGCKDAGVLVKIGLADPAAKPAEVVDLACDPSDGSTCTVESLDETLAAVLSRAAVRPGSVVRVWVLGASIDTTDVKVKVTSPTPVGRTGLARAKEAARWQAQEREVILARVALLITVARRPTSSPLAESITKIALTDGHGLARKIVIISDGRQEGDGMDFECGPLPSDASWAARLKKLRLLAPGTLAGVDVWFTYLTMPPITRCSVSFKREMRIRELWTTALAAAGANEVRMLSGPATWDEHVGVRSAGDGK